MSTFLCARKVSLNRNCEGLFCLYARGKSSNAQLRGPERVNFRHATLVSANQQLEMRRGLRKPAPDSWRNTTDGTKIILLTCIHSSFTTIIKCMRALPINSAAAVQLFTIALHVSFRKPARPKLGGPCTRVPAVSCTPKFHQCHSKIRSRPSNRLNADIPLSQLDRPAPRTE